MRDSKEDGFETGGIIVIVFEIGSGSLGFCLEAPISEVSARLRCKTGNFLLILGSNNRSVALQHIVGSLSDIEVTAHTVWYVTLDSRMYDGLRYITELALGVLMWTICGAIESPLSSEQRRSSGYCKWDRRRQAVRLRPWQPRYIGISSCESSVCSHHCLIRAEFLVSDRRPHSIRDSSLDTRS